MMFTPPSDKPFAVVEATFSTSEKYVAPISTKWLKNIVGSVDSQGKLKLKCSMYWPKDDTNALSLMMKHIEPDPGDTENWLHEEDNVTVFKFCETFGSAKDGVDEAAHLTDLETQLNLGRRRPKPNKKYALTSDSDGESTPQPKKKRNGNEKGSSARSQPPVLGSLLIQSASNSSASSVPISSIKSPSNPSATLALNSSVKSASNPSTSSAPTLSVKSALNPSTNSGPDSSNKSTSNPSTSSEPNSPVQSTSNTLASSAPDSSFKSARVLLKSASTLPMKPALKIGDLQRTDSTDEINKSFDGGITLGEENSRENLSPVSVSISPPPLIRPLTHHGLNATSDIEEDELISTRKETVDCVNETSPTNNARFTVVTEHNRRSPVVVARELWRCEPTRNSKKQSVSPRKTRTALSPNKEKNRFYLSPKVKGNTGALTSWTFSRANKVLNDKLDDITARVNSIYLSICPPVPTDKERSSSGLPILPLASNDDLENFEKYIAVEEQKISLMIILADCGGTDLKDIVFNIMKKLMTNALASGYNLEGRNRNNENPKRGFKKLDSYSLLHAAVKRRALRLKTRTKVDLYDSKGCDSWVSRWLKDSPKRHNPRRNLSQNDVKMLLEMTS